MRPSLRGINLPEVKVYEKDRLVKNYQPWEEESETLPKATFLKPVSSSQQNYNKTSCVTAISNNIIIISSFRQTIFPIMLSKASGSFSLHSALCKIVNVTYESLNPIGDAVTCASVMVFQLFFFIFFLLTSSYLPSQSWKFELYFAWKYTFFWISADNSAIVPYMW